MDCFEWHDDPYSPFLRQVLIDLGGAMRRLESVGSDGLRPWVEKGQRNGAEEAPRQELRAKNAEALRARCNS